MKKKRKAVLVVVGVLIVGMAVFVWLNLPKQLVTNDSAYDLTQLADGTYVGNCDNGIVKAQVEVEVQDHAITDIEIIEHQNGLGGDAEAITNDVLRKQSIEVDTITGATMSSETILKAIENALKTGGSL